MNGVNFLRWGQSATATWATIAACAAAPNSVLYDRVRDRQMTEMRCSAQGEKIEASVVGSLHLSPDLPAVSLITWLKSRAVTVGLQPHTGVRLVRLIFEYGLVGALLVRKALKLCEDLFGIAERVMDKGRRNGFAALEPHAALIRLR